MSFCIVRGERRHNINKTTHVEFEQIHPRSIANFKSSITNADIMSKLDMGPSANPNDNYKILSDVITTAKANHIPKKLKKIDRRKFKKQPWMTDQVLKLVNRKNDLYRNWKSTSDNFEYEQKKQNFKTYDRIVNQCIRDAKNLYYFNTFTNQKNDMKKCGELLMKH